MIPRNDITGSTRPFVEEMQRYLRTVQQHRTGSTYVPADGFFGSQTARGVREFQQQYGLPASGSVDLATWTALFDAYQAIQLLTTAPVLISGLPQERPPMRIGDRGDEVAFLQIMLRRLGRLYANLLAEETPTGEYTDETRRAVLAIQQLLELPPTGDVDKVTWNEITTLYNLR